MEFLEAAERTLLNRLAISPTSRQVNIAKELGVTRSAVNQAWKRLEQNRGLAVQGAIDYGLIGLRLIFGWALDSESSDSLFKFGRWLESSPFVSVVLRSMISSGLDSRVYFEAVIPFGRDLTWFCSQLDRFRKAPYSLDLEYDTARVTSDYMNLGTFDGQSWGFEGNFRFHASIDAVKDYAEILPTQGLLRQSEATLANVEKLVLALCLENNYYTTSSEVQGNFGKLGIDCPPKRTIRRHLATMRNQLARPYVEIDRIGLKQRILICLTEDPGNRTASRLLHAQANTLPKAHIVSGDRLTVLDLRLPESVGWAPLTSSLLQTARPHAEVSTFIVDSTSRRKALERVVPYLAQRTTLKVRE